MINFREVAEVTAPDLNPVETPSPSKTVGQAYAFLLERRLDRGPVSEEEATQELLGWWAARQSSDSVGS